MLSLMIKGFAVIFAMYEILQLAIECDRKLKQFVFQSSERVRSWLDPIKDAGRPGGWDWKERCSSEHVRRDVPASVTPQSRK